MVPCPICNKNVKERNINAHIDSECQSFIETDSITSVDAPVSTFFKAPAVKRETNNASSQVASSPGESKPKSLKRTIDETTFTSTGNDAAQSNTPTKKSKLNALDRVAPLAERMRPTTLDEVCGQELVGPSGVLRGLIESDRVPSMVLWGGAGTGKTTIARVIANMVGSRFVEINSTTSGVAECKKIFADARAELGLTGRKTIIFCDEIHRFSKSQQDVFLGPVEAGHVTLIGATTENPSFKVQNALLSRCRTFTLSKLADEDIIMILKRALDASRDTYQPGPLVNEELLEYLAAFADGDARTSLNLLELAMDLSKRPKMTAENLKAALTKTLVYDRSGDQHYDTISAFHKSVRGSDPDAALYYLARMIQSGEDALYIARRMIVMASEDVGLADNNMLSLATATYAAAEKIGLPEARINLAHCAVALSLAPKSTRAYRGLSNAQAALMEPGIAGLPIPIHLRNAPTRLMKELGYGKEYKYNPSYVNGRVKQEYLPDRLKGRQFLEGIDLGTERDPELEYDSDEANPNAAPPAMSQGKSSSSRPAAHSASNTASAASSFALDSSTQISSQQHQTASFGPPLHQGQDKAEIETTNPSSVADADADAHNNDVQNKDKEVNVDTDPDVEGQSLPKDKQGTPLGETTHPNNPDPGPDPDPDELQPEAQKAEGINDDDEFYIEYE